MGNGKNVHLSAFAQVFFCITLITFEAPSALFEIQGDHVFTKPEGSAVYNVHALARKLTHLFLC